MWYIVELRLETRPRQITQSPENPNEGLGFIFEQKGTMVRFFAMEIQDQICMLEGLF